MGFSLLDNIIQQEVIQHCTDLGKREKIALPKLQNVSFGKQI